MTRLMIISALVGVIILVIPIGKTQTEMGGEIIKGYDGLNEIHAYISTIDAVKQEDLENSKAKLRDYKKSEFETSEELRKRAAGDLEIFKTEQLKMRELVQNKVMFKFPVVFQYIAETKIVVLEANHIIPDLFLKNISPGSGPGIPYSTTQPGNPRVSMKAPAFINNENFYLQTNAISLEQAKILRQYEKDNVICLVLTFSYDSDYLQIDPASGPPTTAFFKPIWKEGWLKVTLLECKLINQKGSLEIPLCPR